MKILLVGGLGFIGRRFLRKFSNTHELIVFAKEKSIANFKGNEKFKNVIFESGLVEKDDVKNAILKHRPEAVIHLAALTGLKKCHDDPEKSFLVNVFGTFNVISACSSIGAKLIFISSREVYGETKNKDSKEDEDLHPNNVYGLTKLLGENLVKLSSSLSNLDYTILRITNVYGPEGDNYGVQIIIKNAIKEKKIKILGGEQRLNFIFVDDVVDLLVKILNNKNAIKQTFNIGSKDTLSIEELVEKIQHILDFPITVEHLAMRETETSNFKPNLKKAKELLDFEASTLLEDGLRETIKWYSK